MIWVFGKPLPYSRRNLSDWFRERRKYLGRLALLGSCACVGVVVSNIFLCDRLVGCVDGGINCTYLKQYSLYTQTTPLFLQNFNIFVAAAHLNVTRRTLKTIYWTSYLFSEQCDFFNAWNLLICCCCPTLADKETKRKCESETKVTWKSQPVPLQWCLIW